MTLKTIWFPRSLPYTGIALPLPLFSYTFEIHLTQINNNILPYASFALNIPNTSVSRRVRRSDITRLVLVPFKATPPVTATPSFV
jgi:hypothetical protein